MKGDVMKWMTALVVCMGLAGAAGAGTEVETETRKADGEMSPGHAFFDGRRVRIDISSGRRAFIYRGDEGLIWLVDHKKKDYLQVTRPSAAGLAAAARSRLDDEQRAAVDLAAGVDPELEIRKTGTRSTVTGVPCDELQIHQGGRRVADVCLASYADAGVSRESFAGIGEVQELLRDALAAFLDSDDRSEALAALESFGRLEGVPMRVRAYNGDSVESETVVTKIQQKVLPKSAFDLPEDYRAKLSINIRGRP
jgi:hypothetical protein